MAAKLRINLGAIQTLAYGKSKTRIHLGALQVLWTEEIYWGCDFISQSSIEADLTIYLPELAPLIGRWTFPIVEKLNFFTEILQSHDRTEQRIAKRYGIPRQSFSTRLFFGSNQEFAAMEAILHTFLKKRWYVPIWPEAEIHEGILSAGSSQIEIDTRYADFRDDSLALIWQSKELNEFIQIDTVQDNLLTLFGETVKDYEGSKFIMPVRIGRCLQFAQSQRFHGGGLLNITWEVEDVKPIQGFEPDLTYDDLIVLTKPSYFIGDYIQRQYDPDIAILDSETGPFEIVSNSQFNEVGQSHIFQQQTKESCFWLRKLLHAIKGRQRAFLVPTFRSDFILTRPVESTDTSIYIQNVGLAQNMGLSEMRKYIAFRPKDAQIIVRRITQITLIDENEEKIDIDAKPDEIFEAGESLSWIYKYRLAEDGIELSWYEFGKLSAEMSLVRVL